MPYFVGVTSLFWIFDILLPFQIGLHKGQVLRYLTPFKRGKLVKGESWAKFHSQYLGESSTFPMHVLGLQYIAPFRSQIASKRFGWKVDAQFCTFDSRRVGGRDEWILPVRHNNKTPMIYFWWGDARPFGRLEAGGQKEQQQSLSVSDYSGRLNIVMWTEYDWPITHEKCAYYSSISSTCMFLTKSVYNAIFMFIKYGNSTIVLSLILSGGKLLALWESD